MSLKGKFGTLISINNSEASSLKLNQASLAGAVDRYAFSSNGARRLRFGANTANAACRQSAAIRGRTCTACATQKSAANAMQLPAHTSYADSRIVKSAEAVSCIIDIQSSFGPPNPVPLFLLAPCPDRRQPRNRLG